MSGIAHAQRFTARQPCPVCGGHANLPQGRGVRCYGFLGSDGLYAHCTRQELAGPLPVESDSATYAHRLSGECQCGMPHAEPNAVREPFQRSTSERYTKPEPPPEADLDLPPAVIRWFAKRAIPEWVLADFQISAGMEWMPQFEKESEVIRFPYFRDGELVNCKYRGNPKAFKMVSGAERILYNLDATSGAEEIVIVEGEMDALSIAAAHGPPCVSVPDGAPAENASNYAGKFSFLSGVAEERLKAAKRVLIATDMDGPGRKLADELARRIGYAKCQRVTWPEGCKDANDTLIAHGVKGVCDALHDAQPYPVAGIVTVRDLYGELDDLYQHGFDRGCDVDWPTFDQHYRARTGLLTIMTGSPSAGKSQFLDNLMVRLARRHGWTFGVCSPENQPLRRHAAGLMTVYWGKPFDDGPTPRMSPAEMHEARAWVDQHFTFVLPDDPSIDTILERAEVLVYRNGIQGLLVDPWNELSHSRPAGQSLTDFASEFLSKLRTFARTWNVHVWLVAHPTKLQKEKNGKYPVPTMYDISDSSHFFNKADYGLSIWRDVADEAVPSQVHIQKRRFKETGQPGMVEFHFDKPTDRFFEVGAQPMHARPVSGNQRDFLPVALPSQESDPWDAAS